MLGRGSIFSLFITNVLFTNVIGKTSWALLETEDEQVTQGGAVAQGETVFLGTSRRFSMSNVSLSVCLELSFFISLAL